ncbi:MAG: hypothetical protein KJO00_02685 [Bacteroidia bacterium]|nr:hypothetical protein [Bacteroidia bacterium]MBT8286895.1 hypothetical protein [Bacteroidia bacterium]NNK74091.1 hypothetical protein [Flavobacteriaceae bacterium]
MKNLAYIFGILIISLYSCSVEEVDTDTNIPLNVLDLNAADAQSQSRSVNTTSCFRTPLVDKNEERFGWLIFTVLESELKVDYQLRTELSIVKTNLSIESWTMEEADDIDTEVPVVENFAHQTEHSETGNRFTYMIDKNDIWAYSRYASHIIVEDVKGQVIPMWAGKWSRFMFADFSYCGDWPDKSEICNSTDNIDFFAPLMPETSGPHPEFGTSSDTVTLNQNNPYSEGSVEIALNFTDLPEGFKDATISIDFEDLDLHTDTLHSGGNTVNFAETFTLKDEYGKIIIALDENHYQDGNFTFTHELSNYLFNDKDITLYATITASLDLIEGNGITAKNTIEKMTNISICGIKTIK